LLDALAPQLTKVCLDWVEGDIPEDDLWLDVLLCCPKLRQVKLAHVDALSRDRSQDPCHWRALDVSWLTCDCVPKLPLQQLVDLHVGVLQARVTPDAAATAAAVSAAATVLAAIAATPHQKLRWPEQRMQLRLLPGKVDGGSSSDDDDWVDVGGQRGGGRQGPQPKSVQALLRALAPLGPHVDKLWLGVKAGVLAAITAEEMKALSVGLGQLQALDIENVVTSSCFWASIQPNFSALHTLMLSFPLRLDAAALALFCGIAARQLKLEFYEPEDEAAGVIQQVQRSLREQGAVSRVQLKIVRGTAIPMCV
jgi:hypothetical protein